MRTLAACMVALAVFGSIVAVGCKGEPAQTYTLAEYCEQGDFDGVLSALQDGSDPDGEPGDLGAPLFNALDSGYFTIAGILVQNGADVDIELASGKTLVETFEGRDTDQLNQVEEMRLQRILDWFDAVDGD